MEHLTDEVYLWTDGHYCTGVVGLPRSLDIFVGYRMTQITECYPLIIRIMVEGTEYITKPKSFWPNQPQQDQPVVGNLVAETKNEEQLRNDIFDKVVQKYSNFNKLIRVLSYCVKFIKKLKMCCRDLNKMGSEQVF